MLGAIGRIIPGNTLIHQPEELLDAATTGGMRALGWEAGELKPGMLADFVTLEQPRSVWRELSASYVVYGFSGSDSSGKCCLNLRCFQSARTE